MAVPQVAVPRVVVPRVRPAEMVLQARSCGRRRGRWTRGRARRCTVRLPEPPAAGRARLPALAAAPRSSTPRRRA